ncbi:hypothetical protein DRE_00885 [Drechslerella stenobrocha 248]|uniref:DUF6697 domain-containing protein n=1 Tax=Drechslerella stenobrocha 248 TaxID=1043628 RepID=W7HN97_9PEZI|nr:hypothetical protein DRE_00885 [Drechslerella stenobrocha 248]
MAKYRRTNPALTEPLTPREWADFRIAIGDTAASGGPQADHFSLHDPSWDLDLMRLVIKDRWRHRGREGSPRLPKPVEREPSNRLGGCNLDENFEVGSEDSELLAGPDIAVVERERKRKKIDYGIFTSDLDFDADEEGEEALNADRRGLRRRSHQAGRQLPSDPIAGDGALGELPKPAYNGRKRGRPRKASSQHPPGTVTAGTNEDIPMLDAGPEMPSTPGKQKRRRQVLIQAVNKAHSLSPVGRVSTPRDKIVSMELNPTRSVSAMGESCRGIEDAERGTSWEEGGHSPTSSVYESVGPLSDYETTLPAGILCLDDLPPELAATIPADPEFFSRRGHIGPLIGGSHRTQVTPVKPDPNAPIETKGYLALQPAWNPHAPKRAGQNGSVMHMVTTLLDPISKSQPHFPVFVARGRSRWEYCGQYVVAEVAELSRFQRWMHLISAEPRRLLDHWGQAIIRERYGWAKRLFTGVGGWSDEKWTEATVDMVIQAIQDGDVPMNWMHLRCVGFDRAFYDALMEAKAKAGLTEWQLGL